MKKLKLSPPPHLPEPAFKVWQTLRQNGYECLCAGGWVRDSLMKRPSDDIDLATSATPEEVSSLFERTLELGKRFGSVVVLVSDRDHIHNVEVTTFRNDGIYLDGRRPISITASNPPEDAQRRDFTINGLFYDPQTSEVIDYVGGLEDLEKGIIRAIGDPYKRFEEDRLRILRAVRFSTRLHYPIESDTFKAMETLSSSLVKSVSPERILQELVKINQDRSFKSAISLFHSLGLLFSLFQLEITSSILEERLAKIADEIPLILKLALLWDHTFSFSKECFLSGEFLKVSRRDFTLLERLEEGLFFIDQGIDPLKNLLCIEWAKKTGDDFQHLCLVLNALRGSKISDTLWENLSKHPLTKYLKENGALFKALDIKHLNISPGPFMGKILLWLHEKAAYHQSIDKLFILNLLQTDPEGQALIALAHKGKSL